MKRKLVILVLTISFLIPLAFTKPTIAETNLGKLGYFMYFEVTTPREPKVGEEISVSFYFEAQFEMHISSISIWLYGAGIDYSKTIVIDVYVDLGITEITDTVSVTPKSSGSIYCNIYADYELSDGWSGDFQYADLDLDVAYVRYTTYSELLMDYYDLLDDYYDLNSTYQSLLADYDELLINHGNLQSAYDTLLSNYTTLKSNYDGLEANHTALQNNYDSLQATYNSLNSTYNSLKTNYDNLQSQHDTSISELGTTRNLSYILIIATIVFGITTVFFAIRKPKVKSSSEP